MSASTTLVNQSLYSLQPQRDRIPIARHAQAPGFILIIALINIECGKMNKNKNKNKFVKQNDGIG